MRLCSPAVVGFVLALAPTSVAAQLVGPPSANLAHAEGQVYLNEAVVDPDATPATLAESVVVRTGEGRAAIALKRGGLLFLDAASSVRVFANSAYNFNRIEVLTGSAILASETSAPLVACENEIRLSDGGLFRFDVETLRDAGERYCKFRVFDGAAAVPLVSVIRALRAGQMMHCNRRCGDMTQTREFSPEQFDDFDQWGRQLHERLRARSR